MPLKFKIIHHRTGYLNPADDMKPTMVDVEIRRDPLTDDRSRILSFRLRTLGKLEATCAAIAPSRMTKMRCSYQSAT